MTPASPTAELHALARQVFEGCTECRACQFRCAFLNEHGTPKQLAERLLTTGKGRATAFECSLCGLCATICPMGLPLTRFFLTMRRAALDSGRVSLLPYRPLLTYERIGSARPMTLFHLPRGGHTVFFPGCAFPGAHPATAAALLTHLRRHVPGLGLVLACCFKPSHDLGRQEFFERRFDALLGKLRSMGVKTVLTACPNCFKVFSEYGGDVAVKSVYEILSDHPVPGAAPLHGEAVVHTPCAYRGESRLQETLRRMTVGTGLEVRKTRQDGALSPCCGEGGAVGLLRPDFPATWEQQTSNRAQGGLVVTSCAGCVNFLSRHARTEHLLDLLFFPEQTMARTLARPKGIATYLHRLLFKWRAILGRP